MPRILIDTLPDGRQAAALWDRELLDLLIEPRRDDPRPQVGAIYRAIAGRPMKGQGGMMVALGGKQECGGSRAAVQEFVSAAHREIRIGDERNISP